MEIIDIYSKRAKSSSNDGPDVFGYGSLNSNVKIQIQYIFDDLMDPKLNADACSYYEKVVQHLCREYGEQCLHPASRQAKQFHQELYKFFLLETSIERQLDVIELFMNIIKKEAIGRIYNVTEKTWNEAKEKLNTRFKESSIGYRFEKDQIIRIDSGYLHQEVTKEALNLIADPKYKGSLSEFLAAHEHYKRGDNESSMNECLKSFESTMKIIIESRGWDMPEKKVASALIDCLKKNRLFPSFWNSNIDTLISLLKNSIPPGRNKQSGHGKGSSERVVPDYFAAYMLHMTASTIIFLIQSENCYQENNGEG